MIGRLVLGLAAGLSLGTTAPIGPRYGDTLVAEASQRFGAGFHIEARPKSGAVIAIGEAIAGGVTVPLDDAMGSPIGTLTVTTMRGRDAAKWFSRRIYVADNLAEPDPFVPGAVRARRAQTLVDRMLDRFPGLVTLALHVAPPGKDNIIIASSFGRIGKAADKDDLHVERDGAVLREVTNAGRRLAVELPLTDRSGHVIGALSTSFTVSANTDPQSLYPEAVAVRDAMARDIASLEALVAR